jgi:hypothetical protein
LFSANRKISPSGVQGQPGAVRVEPEQRVRYGPDDLSDEGSSFSVLMRTAAPEVILALLEAATGEVETAGDEDVRGDSGDAPRASIDPVAALERAPEDECAMSTTSPAKESGWVGSGT